MATLQERLSRAKEDKRPVGSAKDSRGDLQSRLSAALQDNSRIGSITTLDTKSGNSPTKQTGGNTGYLSSLTTSEIQRKQDKLEFEIDKTKQATRQEFADRDSAYNRAVSARNQIDYIRSISAFDPSAQVDKILRQNGFTSEDEMKRALSTSARQTLSNLKQERRDTGSAYYHASAREAGERIANANPKDNTYREAVAAAVKVANLEYKYRNGYWTPEAAAEYTKALQMRDSSVQKLLAAGHSQKDIDLVLDYAVDMSREDFTAQMEKDMAQFAKENPVLGAVASVGTGVLKGADYVKVLAKSIGHSNLDNLEEYRPILKSDMQMSGMSNALSGGVIQRIEEDIDNEFLEAAAVFAAQTGMSIASSMSLALTVPALAPVILGTGAAADATRDAIDRGATNTQALLVGAAAGVAEMAAERFSIEKLLDPSKIGKSWVKETLKQAGVEASEEMVTEITNIISDAAIMANKSNWSMAKQQYMAQGMTEEQAVQKVLLDNIKSVGLAGLAGAVSGGVSGGAVNAVNLTSYRENPNAQTTTETAPERNKPSQGEVAAPVQNETQNAPQAVPAPEIGKEGDAVRQSAAGDEVQTAQVGAQSAPVNDAAAGSEVTAPVQTAPQRAAQRQTEGKAVRPGVVDARTRADAAPLEQTLKKRDVLYLEAASKATGVPINIVDATEGADGWYENGQIYLAENCEDPMNWVATHEITHHLEQAAPEAYNEYLECVRNILQEEGGLEEKVQKIRQHYAEQGTELTEDGAVRELAANFTERLLLDESLFRRVAEENRSVAQRLLDSLKEFIRKLRTAWSGPEIRALENARKAWETALRESRGKTVEQAERRYMYAGQNAKTADKADGWFVGADGKRRFEIDDSGMKVKGAPYNFMTLEELIDHPALFEAYPDMRGVEVTFEILDDGSNGRYNRQFDSISINYKLKNKPSEIKSVLVHEIQHAIQHREGFAGGSTMEAWERRVKNGFDPRKEADRRKAREVEEKLEAIKKENPEFYREMMELDAMTPNVPRGEVDWDTLEKLEEDPVEWQRYDARREQLEGRYGDMEVWDFNDLLYERGKAAANQGRTAYELYRDTAGEIEARDAVGRLDLTAEQRRSRKPYTGNEDTVFADGPGGYFAMSADEQIGIREQLRENQDRLNAMEVVGRINTMEYAGLDTGAARKKLVEEMKKTGYKIDRQGFGEIRFEEGEINNSLNYKEKSPGAEDARRTGFLALKNVLKRGIEIDGHGKHKGRNYDTVTIAAPVEINGKRGNMAVVIKQTKGNRYKVHRILTPEGGEFTLQEMANAEVNTVGAVTNGSQSLGGSAPAINSASKVSISKPAGKSNNKFSDRQNSLRGARELEKQAADVESQNRRLDERAAAFRRAGVVERSRPAAEELDKVAGSVLKDFSSQYDRKTLVGQLQGLYDRVTQGDLSGRALAQQAQEVARQVLTEVPIMGEAGMQLRRELRETKINVPKDLQADFAEEGGYAEFRKKYMGRLQLSTESGRSIDEVYEDLSVEYPDVFDMDAVTDPVNRLLQIAEVADSLRFVSETLTAKDRVSVELLSGEIVERLYDLAQKGQPLSEARAKDRREAQNRLRESVAKKERENTRKIEDIRESNRKANVRMRENMSATKLRGSIRKHADALSRKLTRPTDKQHIPEHLRGTVLALLEVIDLESKYGYQFTREATFRRVNRAEDANLEPTSRTNAARALKAAYEKLRSDPEFNASVDPDLADMLEEIADMGDIRVADMNSEQLRTVWNAVRAVEASVTKSDKMLGASRYEKISSAAAALNAEMGKREDRKNLVGVLGRLDRMINLDMLTPETFLHRMGKVGEDIHRQMRRAQDKNVEILKEGVETYRRAAEETGVDLLKAEKELHEFKLPGGTIELTTAQVMELYALSKREAAMEHIYEGGLRAKGGRKGLVETGKSKAVKVTMMDVADILEVLTPEQKKLMDTLQRYMSTQLAAHGNEASMDAYGYEKFKEKAYWPIKVSKTETDTDPGAEARAKTIPGFGMTKALQPHANNSVELRSALDTYGEHLNQMATYASWLTTSENITKLMNYDMVEEGTRLWTVKDLLLKIYGKGGEQYLNDLLSDVAQGTKTGSGPGALTDSMFGRWKAAKVGANIRVVLQQPTAIIRAAEMIDPKYMAQIGNPIQGWEKALEWSPIAQWKDWGYFEMDAGRSMRELMAGTDKAIDTVKGWAMAPAGAMDSFAWGMLWNVTEAETKAHRKDLTEGSDEFYRAVAERFGDVIDRTQVVDSVLHRTQIMRSSNALNRMATSFMSEPSKIYNMVARDVYDIKNSERGSEANKRAWKHVARTGVALTASFAVNAIAQSIADAIRDDDREKELGEKFADSYAENFFQNFDPLGYLPYVKDVESIIQGFTVDRPDMEGLADLVQAAKNLVKAVKGDGNKTLLNAGMDALNKALDAFGLPASNIKRDVMGILSTAMQTVGAHRMTYFADKLLLDIRESGNAGVYYDTLYRAMNDDYDAYAEIYADMVKNGMDPGKIAFAMEKRMAEQAGLGNVVMLPADWYAPGENKRFDEMLKKQQAAGGTWMDSVNGDLLELARQLEGLEPEKGASSVTNVQRRREIADSGFSENVKEESMKRVLGATAYSKYLAARDAGVSTRAYVDLLEDIEAATVARRGESGNASQDDVVKGLRKSGLTEAQKRAVWYSYGYKSESPWG